MSAGRRTTSAVFFLLLVAAFAPSFAHADQVVGVDKPAAARDAYAPGEEVVISAKITNKKAFTILIAARLKVLAPDGSVLYNEEKKVGEITGKSAVTAAFSIPLPAAAPLGVYTAQFELRNPYVEKATYFQNRGKPFVVFEVKAGAGRSDPVEQAKKILSRMVDAMNWRNVYDLTEPLAPAARVSLKGRTMSAGDFRQELTSVLPFLTDLVWDAQVSQAVRDPRTGAVRLRVSSTYSAKLAGPVGVTSASLAKPKELASEQKRITDAFNTSADEMYEFNPDASGKLQVTEIVSALPLDATLFERVAALGTEWEAKVAVFGLFYYIEQNDLGKFGGLVGSDFINNDDNGFKSGHADFIESLKADLDHLTAIDHSVRVDDIQFNADRTQARVPVTWDRRARIANKNVEWTIKDQKTTLTLRRMPGSGFGLAQIEGKPLFGNSSRLTRKTLINAGELDGTVVANPLAVSDAREMAVATTTDFPENLPSNSRAGVITASQTFTFTGAVQNFTVPVSSALTIKAWGAGGGGGGFADANGGDGGGGAYATTTVLLTKGDVIQIYVGGGGDSGASSVANSDAGAGGFGYGSGGRGGKAGGFGNSGSGGGGGGSSAVTNQSGTTFYLVAAGGGGGGGAATTNRVGAAGGAGGQNGSTSTGGVAGGTTGASGSKNGTDGGELGPDGGSNATDGGGGGGGGGGYTAGGTGGSAQGGDLGAGGGAGGNSTGTVTAGSDKTPGNSTDADLCAGCAVGGNKSTNNNSVATRATPGGAGYVKISW
ncbi:hypothetical protein HY522_01330 [bacterium]|nr:hypothetical protein [bacterium]